VPLFNVISPGFVIVEFYIHRISIISSELCRITEERVCDAVEPEMSAYFSAHVVSLSQSYESSVFVV
jgi:hypothetical protein